MSHDPHILLEQYAEDVCHPEMSGFALLELLSLRSALVEGETNLSPVQRRRLEEADARLLAAAPIVLARLAEVAPLVELRQRVNSVRHAHEDKPAVLQTCAQRTLPLNRTTRHWDTLRCDHPGLSF